MQTLWIIIIIIIIIIINVVVKLLDQSQLSLYM